MKKNIRKLISHPLVVRFFGARTPGRFVIVGGINTLVGLAAFPLLYRVCGTPHNMNALLVASWLFCTFFAFVTHRHITFRSAGRARYEGGKFLMLSLCTLAINLVVVNAATHFFGANPALVQFVTSFMLSLILTVLNYFGMSRMIFPSQHKS